MENSPRKLGESLGFKSVQEGRYMARDGAARTRTPDVPHCNKKICFAAVDLSFLAHLLRELSDHPKAFFVKFSTHPRDGMYLGRCFFIETEEEMVGVTWAEYKNHPKVFCNVQNDDFTMPWREAVKDWTETHDHENTE